MGWPANRCGDRLPLDLTEAIPTMATALAAALNRLSIPRACDFSRPCSLVSCVGSPPNPPWRLCSIVFELVLGAVLVPLRGNLRRRCDGVTLADVGADGGRAAHSDARS